MNCKKFKHLLKQSVRILNFFLILLKKEKLIVYFIFHIVLSDFYFYYSNYYRTNFFLKINLKNYWLIESREVSDFLNFFKIFENLKY